MRRGDLLVFSLAAIAATPFALVGAQPLSAQVVRDSAGVRIVENTVGLWRPGCAWHLSPAPVVELGRGRDEHDFFHSVSDALILRDGRILVGNAGMRSVPAFHPDGRFAQYFGRPGYGPAEFRSIGILQVLDRDSVLIEDQEAGDVRGLTLWTSAGTFVRRDFLPRRGQKASQHMSRALGRLSSGNYVGILLAGGGIYRFQEQRLVQRPWWLAIVNRDKSVVAQLGPLPAQELFEGGDLDHPWSLDAPYSAPAVARVFNNAIYFTSGTSFEIQRYDASGVLREIFRRPTVRRPIDEASKRAFRRWFASELEREIREVASKGHKRSAQETQKNKMEWLRRAPFPLVAPAVAGFVVDQQGYFWVEDYALVSDTVATWSILDPRGRYLGAVRRPRGVQTLFVRDTLMLGLTRDADDVEIVQMYRVLGRSGRSPVCTTR